jgi:hypothetical protein
MHAKKLHILKLPYDKSSRARSPKDLLYVVARERTPDFERGSRVSVAAPHGYLTDAVGDYVIGIRFVTWVNFAVMAERSNLVCANFCAFANYLFMI